MGQLKKLIEAIKKSAKNNNIYISVATHNGKVKENNEDNYFINGIIRNIEDNIISFNKKIKDDSILISVFDGMGGESYGELASYISAKECGELLEKLTVSNANEIEKPIETFVDKSNDKICQMLIEKGGARGGSTFAIVYIKDNIVYPFSLGDSRIYLLRDKKLNQISTDHTVAMRKYLSKIYTKEEAEKSSESHQLTLFLGVDVNNNGLVAEKYEPFKLMKNDKILLCSDGLLLFDKQNPKSVKNREIK